MEYSEIESILATILEKETSKLYQNNKFGRANNYK